MTNGSRRQVLYVGVRSKNSVATLAIDPRNGQLKQLGMTPVADNPVYLATDKQGNYLLTAYYGAAKAAIYPIKPDGTIDSNATSLVTTDKNPHSIQADPSNQFVFVPNTGADKVLQFKFDSASGKITPNSPAELATGTSTGPRHFWFHPRGNFVYFVNEKGSSVTACRLDGGSGTLAAFQTISTLPEDFTGNNTCAHIETTPDGKHLYASNRGHDSLAIFSIDAESGRLTAVGHQPTEKTPRAFAIDPSGQFLLAAGQGSNQLATYRVGDHGRLQPLAVYPAGKSPAWVQIVPLK
jgi:6-phosphogluconolactonase